MKVKYSDGFVDSEIVYTAGVLNSLNTLWMQLHAGFLHLSSILQLNKIKFQPTGNIYNLKMTFADTRIWEVEIDFTNVGDPKLLHQMNDWFTNTEHMHIEEYAQIMYSCHETHHCTHMDFKLL